MQIWLRGLAKSAWLSVGADLALQDFHGFSRNYIDNVLQSDSCLHAVVKAKIMNSRLFTSSNWLAPLMP
jgi:hypothetical protein